MRTLAMAILAAAFATLGAPAMSWAQSIRVSVPFPFTAGRSEMPAGQYLVDYDSGSQRAVLRQSEGGKAAAYVNTIGEDVVSGKAPAKLVFRAYSDNTYVLSEIWNGRDNMGRKVLSEAAGKVLMSRHGQWREIHLVAVGE